MQVSSIHKNEANNNSYLEIETLIYKQCTFRVQSLIKHKNVRTDGILL